MKDNHVLSQASGHSGFTEEAVQQAIKAISAETGFVAGEELQRRYFYDKEKTYRVRLAGKLGDEPVILRLENLKPETEEELFRQAFRAQSDGSIRPPKTYAWAPFKPELGYGWSIDEQVGERILFDAGGDPKTATEAFMPVYRGLHAMIKKPFTDPVGTGAPLFTQNQLALWRKLADERNPDQLTRHANLLHRLEEGMLHDIAHQELQFMHAHLSGSDIRLAEDGSKIVFANHFWCWRQRAYDLAFPIWHQWMSRSAEECTPGGIRWVTDAWWQASAGDVAPIDLRAMLLNRCYGSLLLDIPAKATRESKEQMHALEMAVVAEAERLLGLKF